MPYKYALGVPHLQSAAQFRQCEEGLFGSRSGAEVQ